jgi:hypothetical protein
MSADGFISLGKGRPLENHCGLYSRTLSRLPIPILFIFMERFVVESSAVQTTMYLFLRLC